MRSCALQQLATIKGAGGGAVFCRRERERFCLPLTRPNPRKAFNEPRSGERMKGAEFLTWIGYCLTEIVSLFRKLTSAFDTFSICE